MLKIKIIINNADNNDTDDKDDIVTRKRSNHLPTNPAIPMVTVNASPSTAVNKLKLILIAPLSLFLLISFYIPTIIVFYCMKPVEEVQEGNCPRAML